MTLSGEQRKQLHSALIDAFPTKSFLEQMLSFELNKNLNTIALGGDLQETVLKLIQVAESQGWIEDLVLAARTSNPGNQLLKAIAQELLPNEESQTLANNLNNIDINSSEHPNHSSFKQMESQQNYPKLMTMNIRIICLKCEENLRRFYLLLDICFGMVEEKFKYRERLSFSEKEGHIRIGIKFGELCFKLTNVCMPLNLRQRPQAEQVFGLVSFTETNENPSWQFQVDEQKKSTLFGSLTNQKLGILLSRNTSCLVETTFKVNVNSNNLGVIEQEGVWDDKTNKKVKETKVRAFLKKVVEPKIENYVSKVVLQYESTTNA